MRYQLLDERGAVKDAILADEGFMAEHYPPGSYREAAEDPPPVLAPRPRLAIVTLSADPDHAAQTTVGQGFLDVTCPAGAVLTAQVELRDPLGNLIPLDQSFRMPVEARDRRQLVALAVFSQGVAQITIPFRESGIWEITEKQINSELPEESWMTFPGLTIYAVLQP